ncbi:MAG: hypothetical protein JRG73_21065 [Deltaproteobacteria bacterium]|nr:hypothetical protein [Deltaproteobacteria bacterium]
MGALAKRWKDAVAAAEEGDLTQVQAIYDEYPQVWEHFDIPAAVLINKADINEKNTQRIRTYCAQHGLDIVGEVLYDETLTEALAQQVLRVEYQDGPVAWGLRAAWANLEP